MGQYFDRWYVIGASEYLCRFHIVLVSTCISIHVLTSNASLFQSPIRIIYSPWCIHFEISVLIYIYWVLESFWIFVIAEDFYCWMYDPPEIELTVGQYAVIILIIKLCFPRSSTHEQRPILLNSRPVVITLHDTSSTTIMAVPPLWNYPSEMVTRLYLVLILFF